MGYYTRVLTTKEDCIPVDEFKSALAKGRHKATIEVEAGDKVKWEQIVLKHPDGLEIASIERNPVIEGSLGEEEIEEFLAELDDAKPESSADWLRSYLPKVKCIYAFQHLSGSEKKNGSEILSAVRNAVWAAASAIIQADGEGFSNEDGYHILWQFSDNVSGSWWMGVIQNGSWIHFQMDLGDRAQRAAFFNGAIPKGARLAK